MVLVALLLSIASMITSSMDLGVAAAIIAIVAVMYALWAVHMEMQRSEVRIDEYYLRNDYGDRTPKIVTSANVVEQAGTITSMRPSYYDNTTRQEEASNERSSIYADELQLDVDASSAKVNADIQIESDLAGAHKRRVYRAQKKQEKNERQRPSIYADELQLDVDAGSPGVRANIENGADLTGVHKKHVKSVQQRSSIYVDELQVDIDASSSKVNRDMQIESAVTTVHKKRIYRAQQKSVNNEGQRPSIYADELQLDVDASSPNVHEEMRIESIPSELPKRFHRAMPGYIQIRRKLRGRKDLQEVYVSENKDAEGRHPILNMRKRLKGSMTNDEFVNMIISKGAVKSPS